MASRQQRAAANLAASKKSPRSTSEVEALPLPLDSVEKIMTAIESLGTKMDTDGYNWVELNSHDSVNYSEKFAVQSLQINREMLGLGGS